MATDYTSQIEQLYVAYFDRPADVAGLAYWNNALNANGGNTAVISAQFSVQPEYTATFSGLTNDQIVNLIYVNLFHRSAESAGLRYWSDLLTAGSITVSNIVTQVIAGAQNADLVSINNKVLAASAFTAALNANNASTSYDGTTAPLAKAWLSGIYDATTEAAAVAPAALNATVATLVSGHDVFTLTPSTDIATANVFNAGLVYTPGGDYRVNTLQDEDVLTGRGTNPTLNATLGSIDGANAGAQSHVVTPTLNGVSTLNLNFTGSASYPGAVNVLDLQNSTGVQTVNIVGITDPDNSVTVKNFTAVPANLSVSNTSSPAGTVAFSVLDSAAAGKADTTTLTVSNVNIKVLDLNSGNAALAPGAGISSPLVNANGIEFVNLVTSGAGVNKIGTFSDVDLSKLTITGSQNLTIGAIDYGNQGKFTTIDGSGATGNLTLTLDSLQAAATATNFGTTGGDVAFTLTTGSGADTINSTIDFGNGNDVVDAGSAPAGGVDTLALSNDGSRSFTDFATYNNFEAVTVTRTGSVGGAASLTVDSAHITGDQTFFLVNKATVDAPTTYVLKNLSAAEATSITIAHSGLNAQSAVNDQQGNNIIDVVSTSGKTVGVTIVNGLNSDPRFNFTLTAPGVPNITINDNDTESNTVYLTDAHTGTITLAGGIAGQFLNLDAEVQVTQGNGYDLDNTGLANDGLSWAGQAGDAVDNTASFNGVYGAGDYRNHFFSYAGGVLLTAANINATGEASDVIIRVGAADQNIQLGSGNDTVIFADRSGITHSTSGLTIADTVVGGGGQDTIVLDGSGPQYLGASEWTNLSGIDVIRLAGVDGTHTPVSGYQPYYLACSSGSGSSISGAAALSTVTTETPFNLTVTNQLVGQTGTNRITILNNDGDLSYNSENSSTINLRQLDGSHFVTFVGPNGDGTDRTPQATQIVQLSDVSANSGEILDGGNPNVGVANGNINILQIFNNATVTVGDLVNTRNFQTVQFWNDTTTAQTLALTIDNATFDRLADAATLYVRAVDSTTVTGAYAELDLEAGSVSGNRNFVVWGSQGADVINTGAGNDVILAYNPTSLNKNQGGDQINGGGGTDRIYLNDTYGFGADTHLNPDTVTVNTAGETVYIYGLQTHDNVYISADSYVWSEPVSPGGHGHAVEWNISGGNVSLVNAYLDDINVTGGTTVLSTTIGGANNNNNVYIHGSSTVNLGALGHLNDHVWIYDGTDSLINSYGDTLTVSGGNTTLSTTGGSGYGGDELVNIIGSSSLDLGTDRTHGLDTINVSASISTTLSHLLAQDTLNVTGGTINNYTSVTLVSSTSDNINFLDNSTFGYSGINLGAGHTQDVINIGLNNGVVVNNALVYDQTLGQIQQDTFVFGTTNAGWAGSYTGANVVPGVTTTTVNANGIITFYGGTSGTTPITPAFTTLLAAQVLNEFETGTFFNFFHVNEHNRILIYNDGANAWVFDPISATTGKFVELVGINNVTGITSGVLTGDHQVHVA